MRLPVLKLQPDDALLWLCISEFLLVLPIPNNPSDTYYGLSPSVFPSPLPPKPSQALMFLLTHLVPVLLQEEKSLQAGLRTEIFTTFQGNHRFPEASQPHVLPTVFIKPDLQSLLLMMSLTEHTKRPDYISTCQIICFLKWVEAVEAFQALTGCPQEAGAVSPAPPPGWGLGWGRCCREGAEERPVLSPSGTEKVAAGQRRASR